MGARELPCGQPCYIVSDTDGVIKYHSGNKKDSLFRRFNVLIIRKLSFTFYMRLT